MIRFFDAVVLAHTKLRVHRIRTGIAIAVSGILFGLIAAVIIVAQGIFDSVDRFSEEGLNSRTILQVVRSGQGANFIEYEHADDPDFVAEVEKAHAEYVAKKQAAAKKHNVTYDAVTEDPSPITVDKTTKQKIISDEALDSALVQEQGAKHRKVECTPFDITAYLAPYSSARIITPFQTVRTTDGEMAYMSNGREAYNQKSERYYTSNEQNAPPQLLVLDESLTEPFTVDNDSDLATGEVPVIVPFSDAEKLLGYTPLSGDVSSAERIDRLTAVRSRIHEVTASYCYRNAASQALLAEAVAQRDEQARNVNNADYGAPSLLYEVPNDDTCGAVTVKSDTRTASEKQAAANYEAYEKELGVHLGEPYQEKIAVRGIGISSDVTGTTSVGSIGSIIQGLLGSQLQYGSWVVPSTAAGRLPAQVRPTTEVSADAPNGEIDGWYYSHESYLVEFDNKAEARALMKKQVRSVLAAAH